MEYYRTPIAEETATRKAPRSAAHLEPAGADGDIVHPADRHFLGNAAAGNGLRVGHDLLAPAQGVARSGGMGPIAPNAAVPPACCRETGLGASGGGFIIRSRRARGKKTEPNPTDRRKAGSKHHLLTDAQGIPVSITLTGTNRHDVTQLLGLVDAIPPIAGKRGHPLRRPKLAQADRGYDSEPHRKDLAARGIKTLIARRRTEHGSGLGKTRWVVERTIAWLHQFRRLRVRYERLADIHEAFLKIGCAIICWRSLKKCNPSFC